MYNRSKTISHFYLTQYVSWGIVVCTSERTYIVFKSYHPEMNEVKPTAQIEAQLSHYGKHWFVKTPLQLKGRGIVFLDTLTADKLTPQGQRLVGWHQYKVTEAAFTKLCEQYDVVSESLL